MFAQTTGFLKKVCPSSWLSLAAFFVFAACTTALAAEGAALLDAVPSPVPMPPPPNVPEFSWWGYVKAIAVMFGVLFALWVALMLVRRTGRLAGMPRGTLPRENLFIEAQLGIAPRKGLMVVRFLNKRLLLGITEQHISLLTELELDEKPSFSELLETEKPEMPETPGPV